MAHPKEGNNTSIFGFLSSTPRYVAPPVFAARRLNILPAHEFHERMKNLRRIMYEEGYTILWLTNPETIAALTGYERKYPFDLGDIRNRETRRHAPSQTGYMPAAVAVHVESSSTMPPTPFDFPANAQRWQDRSTCKDMGALIFDEEESLETNIASIIRYLAQRSWFGPRSTNQRNLGTSSSIGYVHSSNLSSVEEGARTNLASLRLKGSGRSFHVNGSTNFKIGMEYSAPWRPFVFEALKESFEAEADILVADCSEDVMPRFEAQMRSNREIECLRLAADLLAVGIQSIRQRLDINRTELDLYGTHVHHMVAAGGEIPWKYPGTIKVNPLHSYEIPGRTEVRPGDMVLVSTSGVFEGQYASCCRAFYLKPFPSPFDVAPVELHEAFKRAGSLFTAFETSQLFNTGESTHDKSLFPIDTTISNLNIYDLCVMINKHFDEIGCLPEHSHGSNVASGRSSHADAGSTRANFTRSCELLLGSDESITIDVDDFIEQCTGSKSKANSRSEARNIEGSNSSQRHLKNEGTVSRTNSSRTESAWTVLHAGAVLRVKAAVFCSLKHNGIRVAATLSETVIVRNDCIEPLGPTPRRLVEVSPLSWLWT